MPTDITSKYRNFSLPVAGNLLRFTVPEVKAKLTEATGGLIFADDTPAHPTFSIEMLLDLFPPPIICHTARSSNNPGGFPETIQINEVRTQEFLLVGSWDMVDLMKVPLEVLRSQYLR